jgi:hypothetical protein
VRRGILSTALGVLATLVFTSTVLGFECSNVSKSDPTAGAQVVIGPAGEILFVTPGLASRIERGMVDPETGEGFHGQVALDIDGDGVADFSIFMVGPSGEIPLQAQLNGPACRGLTNLGLYFEQCLGS